MHTPTFKQHALHAACALALASIASLGMAQTAMERDADKGAETHQRAAPASSTADAHQAATMTSADQDSAGASDVAKTGTGGDAMQDIAEQLQQSRTVAEKMAADPKVNALMKKAKGIFFIPKYGQGALIVGAKGGQGVMVANNNGTWSNPAFYNMGGISFGAQVGVEMGEVAMLLMSDKAVNSFKQDNKFSLDATAGLTIANYTAKAQEEVGRGDIVVWSDTKGAFADLAVGVTDINFDDDENRAFYGKNVTAAEIIKDTKTNAKAKELLQSLPGK